MNKVYSIIRTQFVGIHWFESDKFSLNQDNDFLKHPHRHVFKVEVALVETDDREVEYIVTKLLLDEVIKTVLPLKSSSCETIASILGTRLIKMGYVISYVQVMEDGENGAKVEF